MGILYDHASVTKRVYNMSFVGVSSGRLLIGWRHALQGIMGSAGPVPRVTVTLGMPPPTTVQRYACNAGPPVCHQQQLQCPGWCTRGCPGRSLTHPLKSRCC